MAESRLEDSAPKNRWKRIIDLVTAISTALSGVAALAAVGLSWHLYTLTTAQQASQDATQLYRSFLQLTLEKPNVFGKTTNAQIASFVMTTAESIFLATDDYGWRRTTVRILIDRKELIEATPWDCPTMSSDFVAFARKDAGLRITCDK